MVTDPQTNKPTDRTDYNTLCLSFHKKQNAIWRIIMKRVANYNLDGASFHHQVTCTDSIASFMKRSHGSGHQPHPLPIPIKISLSPSALTPSHWLQRHPHPIPMKFIPNPIKSAVLYITADNLTVYRRHRNISALLRAKCTQ